MKPCDESIEEHSSALVEMNNDEALGQMALW